MENTFTHWRQFPHQVSRGTDCPEEDWWPHISNEAQYRWLRSRYLDKDYNGVDGDAADRGRVRDGVYVPHYGDYHSGQIRHRWWDLRDVVWRVIRHGGLDVVRRLIREQAGLVVGGDDGGGGSGAAVLEKKPLPPGLWSAMDGEDQKFWYDMLSMAAGSNNMEVTKFFVEELGVPPYLFPFPKLPREETREIWAAMDEEAREEEVEDYMFTTLITSPLESAFAWGAVEAVEYLLNTGWAGEEEMPWEGLEELEKHSHYRIERLNQRPDGILQLLKQQYLVRPGMFGAGITGDARSHQRCWLNGCPSLVTVLFWDKF